MSKRPDVGRLLQRLWDVAGAASIHVKVLGIVLGVVILLGVFVVFQLRIILTETLVNSLHQQGEALAAAIGDNAAALIDAGDMQSLQQLLAERKAHYSSESHNTIVLYIAVADASGTLIASEGILPRPSDDVVLAQHPMHQNGGTISIDFSPLLIHQTVDVVTFQVFEITLIMVAVGFAAAFVLTSILTRPLRELVTATQSVALGDLTRRVTRWANDEIGELSTAFNHMTDALQTAAAERAERDRLRAAYINGVIEAQESERTRIARELHDSTGQTLTSLLVGLQNLKDARPDDAEVSERADALRSAVSAALDEVRAISWQLRPSALDDLGLVSALENHLADYRTRFGLPVDLVVRGLDNRLPHDLETAVYRIVLEGLTNIARYAQATSASVVLACRGDKLRIIIEDNGVGFDPQAVGGLGKSLGLQGIRERAGLFGGTLKIESQPGQGTSLFVEIPTTTTQGG